MKHTCETCRFRSYAERKPHTLFARLWRWHTTWCPGWKAYMRAVTQARDQKKE